MSSERRLHPYSVVFAFLTQLRLFVLPGVFLLVGARSRGDDWWQPWMMLFVIPAGGLAVVRYWTYRYRFDPAELVIRSGLLFKQERHIPYDRIQNIDARQTVLHRLLSVMEVRLETGGGEASEARMSVLPVTAFHEMRERVFAGRQTSPSSADTVDTPSAFTPAPAATPLLVLPTRELLLSGFIENRGAVLIAAGFGLLWELGLFERASSWAGMPQGNRRAIRSAVRGVLGDLAVTWERVLLLVAGFCVLLVVLRAVSMLWAVVRLHGFTLTLVAGDARSVYGLFTRMALTIPLRRIQVMTVREGPLHRAFKRVAVRVTTAGGRAGEEGQASERESLAPILRRGALNGLMQATVDVVPEGLTWYPPHPRAFRRAIFPGLSIAAVVCAGLAVYFGWRALFVLLLAVPWAVFSAFQYVKHLRWATSDAALFFRTGWWLRRLLVVRFAKMQAVSLQESPFDRRTGMATLHVDTAGASGDSVIDIPYVPRDVAVALRARLAAAAAHTQFKW